MPMHTMLLHRGAAAYHMRRRGLTDRMVRTGMYAQPGSFFSMSFQSHCGQRRRSGGYRCCSWLKQACRQKDLHASPSGHCLGMQLCIQEGQGASRLTVGAQPLFTSHLNCGRPKGALN
jgi:hypothetical protein